MDPASDAPRGIEQEGCPCPRGQGYEGFTAQHEDEPGDDDTEWELLADRLASFDQRTSPPMDERDDWPSTYVRGPKTQAAVRAFLDSHGRAEEFLRQTGVSLSSEGSASFEEALEPQVFATMRLISTAPKSNPEYPLQWRLRYRRVRLRAGAGTRLRSALYNDPMRPRTELWSGICPCVLFGAGLRSCRYGARKNGGAAREPSAGPIVRIKTNVLSQVTVLRASKNVPRGLLR